MDRYETWLEEGVNIYLKIGVETLALRLDICEGVNIWSWDTCLEIVFQRSETNPRLGQELIEPGQQRIEHLCVVVYHNQ